MHKALQAVRPVFRLELHDGVHGLAHWSRVLWHGRALAAALAVDPALVAWFAFLHDSQRHHDGTDPEHGRRAADFAVRLRRRGVISELAPSQFEQLCEAMRLHSDGHTEHEPALLACWDADRLDLGRVGITPDPSRLCTELARDPQTIARAMWMSQRGWRRRGSMRVSPGHSKPRAFRRP